MQQTSNTGKRFSRYLEQILYVLDHLLLNASFFSSVYIRNGDFELLRDKNYQLLLILGNILWFLIINYRRGLKTFRVERVESTLKKTLTLLLLHFGIMSAFVLFLNFDDVSRLAFIYFYSIFSVLIVSARLFVFFFLKRYRKKGFNFRRVVVVGCNQDGQRIAQHLTDDLSYGYHVKGYFDDELCHNISKPYLGKIKDIEQYLISEGVDEMYVALHYNQHEMISQLILLCEKHLIRIKFIPDFRVYTKARRVNIDFYDGIPVMMFRKEPLEQPLNRILKKLFDLLFSLFVIIFIFSWLFPILALIIKFSSKGPVFFIQERSGEDNQSFKCIKFRTMRVNADSDKIQASKGDPRITKIGAFMRKTNLDELPQFFNVLWGNMSVVGPRPHMLAHTEQYKELINNYLVRHYAKPGITGWAQVNGYRGETKELEEMEGRVKLDIYYIENWSFLLDIKIIWLTVWNMVKGEEKAY